MSHRPAQSARSPRLDSELVRLGLARSRAHARALVEDGAVQVDGVPATKAAAPVTGDAALAVTPARPQWVGRGAEKLAGALERFTQAGLTVHGRRCLDVGAGTGGFTQVLLAAGAAQVVALDVGHGQLHPSLAAHPRVESREGVNIRTVRRGELGPPFDVLVADLSFISLRLVLSALAEQLAGDGDGVLLVKPQFEVGRARLRSDGVVRSAGARLDALAQVCRAAGDAGLGILDVTPSRLQGATGNQEYLVWVTPREARLLTPDDLERRIAQMEQP